MKERRSYSYDRLNKIFISIKRLARARVIYAISGLGFPKLSNDGEYLKVFGIQESKAQIGSPADDNENWFTVRMLLLLESRHLFNSAAYARHTKEILSVYFRDAEDHKPFKPLFLLNDILRFWRTLCLNYEQARHTPSRAWKKKNFNLRFSRMLTVFGTVLPLILDRGTMTSDKFVALTSSSPLERFASGLDQLQNASALIERFPDFLDCYEKFISTKENRDFEQLTEVEKSDLHSRSVVFAGFIFDALTHASVPDEFKRYLVI